MRPDVISTGSLALNCALGLGGWPRGHIVEVYGSDGTAKSMLGLHAARETQRIGEEALIVDIDKSFNLRAAQALGIAVEHLVVARPESGEHAIGMTRMLLASGGIATLIVDSVAALAPAAELEGKLGEGGGLQRRFCTRFFRELHDLAAERNVLVLALNRPQAVRTRVGGWAERTAGGEELPVLASVRVQLTRLQKGDVWRVRGEVVKNSIPGGSARATDLVLGPQGIDRGADLLCAAYDAGIITLGDGRLWFQGQPLGDAAEATRLLRGPEGAAVRAAMMAAAPWRQTLPALPAHMRMVGG